MVGWRLILAERAAAERHAVVDHDVVADLGGLADDHAHAVVDEEPPADGRAGMDLDAGEEPGQLGDQPGREPQRRVSPQPVRQPVEPDRVQAGVGEEVLERTPRRRVVGPGGVEVFLQSCEEAHKDLSRESWISGRTQPRMSSYSTVEM